MRRLGGLQVPQIIVTQDREFQFVPSIKINIEGASSESDPNDEEDDNEKLRPRLRPLSRPNSLRWL
jgi:hypothetical protein